MSGDRARETTETAWSVRWGIDGEDRGIDGTSVRRAFAGTVSECKLVVDDDARIVGAGPGVAAVFGYDPTALVGQGLVDLLPEHRREQYAEAFASAIRTGRVESEWDERELLARHSDGSHVPVAVSLASFTDDGETYFAGVVRDIGDRIDQRERLQVERAFVESMFDALPDIVYAFDQSGSFRRWNERLVAVTGYSDDELEALPPLELVPSEDRAWIATEIAKVVEDGESRTVETQLVTKDGREIPYEITGAPLTDGDEIIGQTGVARDISGRKRRESRLRRLNELNTVIRSVHRALIDATTREEIERAVPERLVDVGAYTAVAVGRHDGSSEGIEDVASAGVSADVLFDCPESVLQSLAREAVRTRSVTTVVGLPDDLDWDGPDRGSVAAVPIVTEGRTFGTLVVVAEHADAFPERERTILAELGAGIGDAIQAAVTRRLLYADTVTELELTTTDSGLVFVRLSDRADCQIELERSLAFGEDDVFYVTTAGASVERILGLAEADAAVTRAAHVGADGERDLFEFVTEGATVTDVVRTHSARTVASVASDGRASIWLELPPDANVREVLEDVTEQFPDTELLARQEVERSLHTPVGYREELTSEMTDKQQAALEAAFSAGYFEWPARANNAEEVAAMLGVTPQTLHQHLRIALRKLLTAVFDAERRAEPDGDRA